MRLKQNQPPHELYRGLEGGNIILPGFSSPTPNMYEVQKPIQIKGKQVQQSKQGLSSQTQTQNQKKGYVIPPEKLKDYIEGRFDPFKKADAQRDTLTEQTFRPKSMGDVYP
ncbi:MAG: hypothetical protein KatS3mg083_248 [Candidatus Dojkabacteria bacterium]|nr:MAG: hypothetical protein KatS3mg083_248 [Candidatus Dojkabacteria bacterium]